MPTAMYVRQVVHQLPEVEERLTWDSATFRVRGRVFALLHPKEESVTVKATPAEQRALLASDDQTFAVARYTGRFGWVRVQLASVDPDQLRELLVEAWHRTAPKRITAGYCGSFGSIEEVQG